MYLNKVVELTQQKNSAIENVYYYCIRKCAVFTVKIQNNCVSPKPITESPTKEKQVSKLVFTPSQPGRLYQGDQNNNSNKPLQKLR